ncbi:serine protease nudel [Danaus plexippus]|uniref:serine protease nudel n=1 Tax=Danaus plexippus TaxID=13037 RepID=UPI002AB003C5|nr:serine protease nudel [Danaus plexippus]
MYSDHQLQYPHHSRPISNYRSHYAQTRNSEELLTNPHPQDIGIAMKFLSPKYDMTSKDSVGSNSTFNEIECPVGTVSCNNGALCIDEHKWCDGNVECDDVSDESKCDCRSRVDDSRICDGYFDCPFGEDEMGCNGCNDNTFSCEDLNVNSKNTCFSKEQRCDNFADCPNQKDEIDCSLLAPSLHKKPLFAISNTEGFLHRNFKGNWYAVCSNPYMWAHDVCRRETGLIIRPPYIQVVQIDPLIKVKYINTALGGSIHTTNTCGNNSAVYVTCPDLLCGTRVLSSSEFLRQNANMEDNLFGRNKRFLFQESYPGIYYGDRKKRYTINNAWQSQPFHYLRKDLVNDVRNKRSDSRVVGGKPSQPAAWPWVVALYRDGMFHCGGVIVNQNWIMSAAHCVNKFWEHYYEVQVGMLRRFSFSPQEQNHRVTHVIVNQNYNQEDMKNDLSLLRVKPGIQFSRWVRPICLPGPEVAGADWMWGPPAGTTCTAVGWGATVERGPDPDHMREVEVPVWEHCKHEEDQSGSEMCAGLAEGGRDSCQGDSGGPLLCTNPANPQQWYVAGIVSHGDGCARKGEPGVYTRVSVFVSWIRYHIASKALPIIQPKQECPGFRCDSGISKCLPKKRMCDKIIDCLDGEDELNCEIVRSADIFPNNLFLNPLAKVANITNNQETININDNEKNNNLPSNNIISVPDSNVNTKLNSSNLNEFETTTFLSNKDIITDTKVHDQSTLFVTTEKSIIKNDDKLTNIIPLPTEISLEQSSLYDDIKHASTIEMPSPDYSGESIDDLDPNESITLDSIITTTTSKYFDDININLNSRYAIESMSSILDNPQKEEKIFTNIKVTEKTLVTSPLGISRLDSDIDSTTVTIKSSDFNTSDENNLNNNIFNNTIDQKDNLNLADNKYNKTIPSTNDYVPTYNGSNNFNESTTEPNIYDQINSETNHEQNYLTPIRPMDTTYTNSDKNEDTFLTELQSAKKKKYIPTPTEFQCRRIYQIVPHTTRCDHKADCEDGSDEQDCTCVDYLTTFDNRLLCDGHFDCADGQDEVNCYTCEGDKFLCKLSEMCLDSKYVCDGIPQCPSGEDEMDCFALTNGNHIERDIHGRPEAKLEGYLTKKYQNSWHVVCEDNMSVSEQEEAATHICRYLGFSSANKYVIKYINVKQKLHHMKDKRSIRNIDLRMPVHFSYRTASENNDSTHVVINEPQIIKEECVPNITKTCMSLYVFCDHSLYTHFDSIDEVNIKNEIKKMSDQMWPWIAKLYVDGKYKCTGVLVDLSWVLINHVCLPSSELSYHYVTVILGSHKTLKSTVGPYEQVYRVDAKKHLYQRKVMLLHLNEPAVYTSMVKPMVVTSLYSDDADNTICVAVGQDRNNKMSSVFLKETDKCNSHNRCFDLLVNSSYCNFEDAKWAGIISCHNKRGWYPAASFVKDMGICKNTDGINGTDIGNLKIDIKYFEDKPLPLSDGHLFTNCEGVRCQRGHCVGLQDVCNGVTNCEDSSDESKESCRKKHDVCTQNPFYRGCECPVGQLKCHNGQCIPKELFKDGRNDCGDGTDEPGQTLCSDYLRRVMPSRLCDGILHCHDRSDEDPTFCKCFAKKAYKCTGMSIDEDYCVATDMVCDGVLDCPNGDDERTCIGLSSAQGTPHGIGEVIIRSHGVWYSKCYTKQNHTKSELEAICRELGFIGGHAKQLPDPKGMPNPYNNIVIDMFSDVMLNNNTIIKLRNTPNPIARAVTQDIKECYPVFIECL